MGVHPVPWRRRRTSVASDRGRVRVRAVRLRFPGVPRHAAYADEMHTIAHIRRFSPTGTLIHRLGGIDSEQKGKVAHNSRLRLVNRADRGIIRVQAQFKRWKPTKVHGHEDHLLDGHCEDLPLQQWCCAEIPPELMPAGRPATAGLLFSSHLRPSRSPAYPHRPQHVPVLAFPAAERWSGDAMTGGPSRVLRHRHDGWSSLRPSVL